MHGDGVGTIGESSASAGPSTADPRTSAMPAAAPLIPPGSLVIVPGTTDGEALEQLAAWLEDQGAPEAVVQRTARLAEKAATL